VVAHDLAAYVAAKDYGDRVTAIWPADDIEASWDPWSTTAQFLTGVRDQERTYPVPHAHLVNYGDAQAGACSVVTDSCQQPWTPTNVYDAAWGIGWAIPLPEAYNAETAGLWESVAALQGARNPMEFLGVMTECAGPDPLPTGPCHPQGIGVTGTSACEWSPTVAYTHMRATIPRLRHQYPVARPITRRPIRRPNKHHPTQRPKRHHPLRLTPDVAIRRGYMGGGPIVPRPFMAGMG
jgi:hypothetical protein